MVFYKKRSNFWNFVRSIEPEPVVKVNGEAAATSSPAKPAAAAAVVTKKADDESLSPFTSDDEDKKGMSIT